MKTVWSSHLKGDEAREFLEYVKRSKNLLDRLKEICYNSILELEKVSIDDYDTASWSHRQAHINGLTEAYRKIIELCDVKEKA